jgi:hypothetical protein
MSCNGKDQTSFMQHFQEMMEKSDSGIQGWNSAGNIHSLSTYLSNAVLTRP